MGGGGGMAYPAHLLVGLQAVANAVSGGSGISAPCLGQVRQARRPCTLTSKASPVTASPVVHTGGHLPHKRLL